MVDGIHPPIVRHVEIGRPSIRPFMEGIDDLTEFGPLSSPTVPPCRIIDELRPGVGALELQAFAQALVQHDFQRVIDGIPAGRDNT